MVLPLLVGGAVVLLAIGLIAHFALASFQSRYPFVFVLELTFLSSAFLSRQILISPLQFDLSHNL